MCGLAAGDKTCSLRPLPGSLEAGAGIGACAHEAALDQPGDDWWDPSLRRRHAATLPADGLAGGWLDGLARRTLGGVPGIREGGGARDGGPYWAGNPRSPGP